MRPHSISPPVKMVCLVTIGWLVFATVVDAVPTRLRFEQISIEHGLPQQSVLSVLQDRHGFMWFATQGGVARFDGYRTVVFRHDREDSNSLSANRVWTMLEDRQGVLWFGTAEGGLDRFDADQQSFRAFRHDPSNSKSLPHDRIWGLHQDHHGRLWVATAGGLAQFDFTTEEFIRQDLGPASQETVRVILAGPSNHLWVGTSNRGLVKLDPDSGPVDFYRHDSSDRHSLPNDRVLSMHRDRAGILWVGTSSGLARFDETTEDIKSFRHEPTNARSLPGHQVQAIFEDRQGNLWIGTDGGLAVFDRAEESFANHRHDPTRAKSLPNDSIASIFEDRTGILWFGTWYGGAAQVNPRTWQIVNYEYGSDPLSSPPGGILSVHQDERDRLWLGTSAGLAHFDPTEGTFSRPLQLDDDDIVGIADARHSGTWVISRSGEIERWETSTQPTQEISLNPNDSLGHFVTASYGDPNGVVWIGHGDLVRLGPGAELTRFVHQAEDPGSLASSGIKCLAADRDGGLWVGTSDRGISHLAAGSERFEHYRLYAETEGQPSISSIYHDPSGWVWIATNAGLFKLQPTAVTDIDASSARTVASFTVDDGLASDLLAAILPGDDGRLWVSSSAGISSFDPVSETFRNFAAADGALPGGYNKGAALRLRDGRMVFGGPQGLTVFRTEEVPEDPTPPLLALTDLRLFNRSVSVGTSEVLDRPIHLADEIVLGPADDVVSFEITALHFANPKANRFAYRLDGFDQDWIPADASHRFATYTDLPPGKYVLRARGSTHAHLWNRDGISLRVTVLPPWWQTWWAYLVYILSLGGLIFGLIFANRRLEALVVARTAEVRAQAQQIKDQHDAKSRFIANVSHEFRTPLTLAIGPLEELRTDRESALSAVGRQNLEAALRNARRMMGLVGQVLDMGRLERGKMRLRPVRDDLAEVVRRESSNFSVESQQRGVALEVDLPDRPIRMLFDLESIKTVLSNLVSNAFKFTPSGGTVRVQLEETTSGARLMVSDTGSGIAEADLPRIFERYYQGSRAASGQPGTGIGLAIVKDLVELHGGRIEAKSRIGDGSMFTVTLPRGRSEDDLATAPDDNNSQLESAVADRDQDQETPPETILIVDDNPELRSFLYLRLSASYHVLEAGDGEHALQIARRELPDLIVSDVTMPGLDGLTMTRKLRCDPEISYIPVLLLTGRATRDSTIEGLQSGADDYLTKPFDSAELAARIAGLLASRRRLGEHLRQQPRSERTGRSSFDQRLRHAIEENLHDSTLSVQYLASALAVDRTVLFRKVKERFGLTPSELIRRRRLERAAELLRSRAGNVSEVGFAVGFTSLSYFGKRFREMYGAPPSRFGQPAAAPPDSSSPAGEEQADV